MLRPSHVGSGSCIRDGKNASVLIEMCNGNVPLCWLIQLSNAITFIVGWLAVDESILVD